MGRGNKGISPGSYLVRRPRESFVIYQWKLTPGVINQRGASPDLGWASQRYEIKKKKSHEMSPKYHQTYDHGERLKWKYLAPKCEWGLPKLRSRGCCLSWWLLRSWRNARSKVNKETGLALDSWGACESNEWRRKWQPTPVFLPRESHGQRSLVGFCP